MKWVALGAWWLISSIFVGACCWAHAVEPLVGAGIAALSVVAIFTTCIVVDS